MKIDRETTFSDKSRADQIRNILQNVDNKKQFRREVSERKKKTTPPHKLNAERYVHYLDNIDSRYLLYQKLN